MKTCHTRASHTGASSPWFVYLSYDFISVRISKKHHVLNKEQPLDFVSNTLLSGLERVARASISVVILHMRLTNAIWSLVVTM